MALIIEDGSIVANADSYVTEAEFISYAADRGVTIIAGATTETILRKAADHINGLEKSLKGSRVSRDQTLAFPRSGLIIDDWDWSYDEIPRTVLLAQMALALDLNAGEDPLNPTLDLPVVRERVEGAVEREYARPTGFKLSKTSSARALLTSLLRGDGYLTLVRG